MKKFNEREKNILLKLLETSNSQPVPVREFIQQYYFSEENKRALILQLNVRYAVFFLDPELFDDEIKNAEEVKYFFELVSLLHYLNKHGYLTFYREKTEKMYFFQEAFGETKLVNNSVILNGKGDHTVGWESIVDKHKKVIYKGIVFKADLFDLILNHTTGLMLISENLGNLLNHEEESEVLIEVNNNRNTTYVAAPPPTSKLKSGLLVLIFIIISSLIVMLFYKLCNYDENFKQIASNHSSIQNNISEGFKNLNNALKTNSIKNNHDSLVYLYGIDISKWNGNAAAEIDPTDSIAFIICKATEGLTGVDVDLKTNWQIIKNKNCLLGVYHFYHTNDDPIQQARHFISTLNPFGKPDLAPIVDIEQQSLPPNTKIDIAVLQSNLLMFLNELELTCKRKPMLYTDAAFADQYLVNAAFSIYELWLAEYTNAQKPSIPATWKEKGFKIWQKRDNYFIDSHPTDYDVYFGKRTDLLQ